MENSQNSNPGYKSRGNRGSSNEPRDATSNMATYPSASGSNVSNNNSSGTPEPYPMHHPDYLIPITNVLRIMKRILPPNAKVSEEAKITIQECLSEYIHFITGEANDRCHREQRKIITAEDLLYAHAKLGFNDYVGPLTLFLERYRQNEAAQNIVHGDPTVRRITYFPDMYTQGPSPLLASAPPLLHSLNPTFQVGEDHQGFLINPSLGMNDVYSQDVPRTIHGGEFDIIGSSSNPSDMYTHGPPPLLASVPPLLPSLNRTFQVGEDHQGFFINPTLGMNELYSQDVPRTIHGCEFDIIGSSSNLELQAPALFLHGFCPGAPSLPGSYPHGHDPNHRQ